MLSLRRMIRLSLLSSVLLLSSDGAAAFSVQRQRRHRIRPSPTTLSMSSPPSSSWWEKFSSPKNGTSTDADAAVVVAGGGDSKTTTASTATPFRIPKNTKSSRTAIRLSSRDEAETVDPAAAATSSRSRRVEDVEGEESPSIWFSSPSSTFSFPSGRTGGGGGVDAVLQRLVSPLQSSLDKVSSGWALSYADLTPDTSATAPGIAFLATNAAYAVAGLALTLACGDYWFGAITEVTALASFNYHYWQLESRGEENSQEVRLALLIDYVMASLSIGTAVLYLAFAAAAGGGAAVALAGPDAPSLLAPLFQRQDEVIGQILAALSAGGVGVMFLGLSWKYEHGKPYMVFHSLWHLFSAYCGYLVGAVHFVTAATAAM